MQRHALDALLTRLALPAATQVEPVGGGCISEALCVDLTDGRRIFLKHHARPPTGFFAAEARGLQALRQGLHQALHQALHQTLRKTLRDSGALRVPEVIGTCEQAIALEWLAPAPKQPNYWEALGQGLAALHRETAPRFGFDADNFCGLTPQHNPWSDDGHAFFAESRLQAQGERARRAGYLAADDLKRLEWISGRLKDWIPTQPASLVHGDLWSGNVHIGPAGEPVLIDPATYYGWAESDLAMTRLFGGFPDRFYRAYAEAASLDADWSSRVPLYNLYHLLNHLNLFGRGYLAEVQSVLRRFS